MKTFSQFLRDKDLMIEKDEAQLDAQAQLLDPVNSKKAAQAVGKTIQSMPGNVVMKAIKGTNSNDQKQLIAKTLENNPNVTSLNSIAPVLGIRTPATRNTGKPLNQTSQNY